MSGQVDTIMIKHSQHLNTLIVLKISRTMSESMKIQKTLSWDSFKNKSRDLDSKSP